MSSEPFVETDPSGRYSRYGEILSSSDAVEEFRAFDQGKGMNVSWSKVKLGSFSSDEAKIKRLEMKISLLKSVKSNNIIPVYKVWRNKSQNTLNIISEICTWNLGEYLKQYRQIIPLRTIKKWCKQILKGLDDLHTHQPCIIHRDLNYTNVFINDTNGLVKIGGFALAEIERRNYLIYDNPKFKGHFQDIFMYGLCVADLVAPGVPHYQCGDPITISLIDKCMTQMTALSAAQLLLDPFFDDIFDDDEEEDDNKANSLTATKPLNKRKREPEEDDLETKVILKKQKKHKEKSKKKKGKKSCANVKAAPNSQRSSDNSCSSDDEADPTKKRAKYDGSVQTKAESSSSEVQACCFDTEDAEGNNEKTIFVKGFDSSLPRDDIKSALTKHFGLCGEITRVFVPIQCDTGVSLGFAFINFKQGPRKALKLNKSDMGGWKLKVKRAIRRDEYYGFVGRRGCERCRFRSIRNSHYHGVLGPCCEAMFYR